MPSAKETQESKRDPGPPSSDLGAGASWRWDILYGLAVLLGWPVLLWRRWVLKKDRDGWHEKKGYVRERPVHSKRIWVHAVSVGEVIAAEALIKQMRSSIPEVEIVVSTTTNTGQDVAKKRFGADQVFYFPLDFRSSLRRCFDRVNPALIVLMELEVWPNFTREALGRGIPVVVVNGRITERSARRYGQLSWILGPSFLRVRQWLMQNEEYAARIKGLGVDPSRIHVSGNVKFDALNTGEVDDEEKVGIRRDLCLPEHAMVIIGGSTHPTEEGALLAAYKGLRSKNRDRPLRLVLVPRHPHRLPEVQREIEDAGFECLRLTDLKEQGEDLLKALSCDRRDDAVILVDTMGELSQLYKATDLAFIGGSLVPHGGQNVMEPAGMGLPTLYGPYMHNFKEAVSILSDCRGSLPISGREDLEEGLEQLLRNPKEAREMGQRARRAFLERQGASKNCISMLLGLLRQG